MEPYLTVEFQPERLVADLPPGTKLAGRFIIKGKLGKGRWGQVFLAEDSLRAVTVAIKVTVVTHEQPEEVVFRYRREVRLYTRLTDFRHVIQIFDLHETPWDGVSLLSLSMEYAEGGSFRTWLIQHQGDQKIRTTKGLEYFLQACRGVMAAHLAAIVNLDPKPDNLLFSGGLIKVSDLGSAHIMGGNDDDRSRFGAATTWIRGTLPYMSPEHFLVSHPGELDARTDIYSLGIIAYELLSPDCKPPFTGGKERVKHCHLNERPLKLQGVGYRLAEVVARCLEKDPDDRFQTVAELITALEGNYRNKHPQTKDQPVEKQHGIEKMWEEASSLYSQGKLA
ncbi:MAG: serine/threonine protein kinase, partial [Syntrophales bacterium LBB04]|nr:serine/threonine protein kinase [Syntrophales bacterium LBB04]